MLHGLGVIPHACLHTTGINLATGAKFVDEHTPCAPIIFAGLHPKGGVKLTITCASDPDCVVFYGIGYTKVGSNHVTSPYVTADVYKNGPDENTHSDVVICIKAEEIGGVNPTPAIKDGKAAILKLNSTSFLTICCLPTHAVKEHSGPEVEERETHPDEAKDPVERGSRGIVVATLFAGKTADYGKETRPLSGTEKTGLAT